MSENKKDGGPAFPISMDVLSNLQEKKDGCPINLYGAGMTLWDYFAANAASGLIIAQVELVKVIQKSRIEDFKKFIELIDGPKMIADFADAMIEERRKRFG